MNPRPASFLLMNHGSIQQSQVSKSRPGAPAPTEVGLFHRTIPSRCGSIGYKTWMMSADLFAPYSELADKLLPLQAGSDGAHDLSHLTRVWRNVKAIELDEGGDLEI